MKLLAQNNKRKFAIGDLVQFDISHILGIVTDVRIAAAFSPLEEILELITSVQGFEDAGSLNETACGEE